MRPFSREPELRPRGSQRIASPASPSLTPRSSVGEIADTFANARRERLDRPLGLGNSPHRV